MHVRNKKSGEVETMRHGPATAAVEAGTHEFVNLDNDGKPIDASTKPATASTKKDGDK